MMNDTLRSAPPKLIVVRTVDMSKRLNREISVEELFTCTSTRLLFEVSDGQQVHKKSATDSKHEYMVSSISTTR